MRPAVCQHCGTGAEATTAKASSVVFVIRGRGCDHLTADAYTTG
jgi:hypothetical protein